MQSELAELVPELRVAAAHGRLKADALEDAVVGLARGEGNVLLATSIIKAGLDIPRADLMIVWGADRFGLAQLHQLRGRVVPEPNLRLSLLRRLCRLDSPAALHGFEEEFHDRFGPPGPALDALLLQARLRLLLRATGVASADLGPEAAALTPVDPTNPAAFAALAARVGGTVHGARVVLPWHERDPAAQAGRLLEMLG